MQCFSLISFNQCVWSCFLKGLASEQFVLSYETQHVYKFFCDDIHSFLYDCLVDVMIQGKKIR